MCLGVPGKITEIHTTGALRMAKVDFGGVVREVCIETLPEAKIGDYTIVHAGFALNLGLTVRGMEFAVASGVLAGEVASEAIDKGNTSEAFLSLYEKRLKESFVLPDMETFRRSKEVLENKRLFTVYPKFLCELLNVLFTIGKGPKEPLYKSAMTVAKRHVLNWDGFKDIMSMRKM